MAAEHGLFGFVDVPEERDPDPEEIEGLSLIMAGLLARPAALDLWLKREALAAIQAGAIDEVDVDLDEDDLLRSLIEFGGAAPSAGLRFRRGARRASRRGSATED